MCDQPEAGELEIVWQDYFNSDDVYIVGACSNYSELENLYEFTQVQGVSFPISASDQLGANFNNYAETFNFIGGNMTLVSQLDEIAQAPLISINVEQAIGSLQGITLMNPINSQFMDQSVKYYNLDDVFFAVNGIDPIYSISLNSNEDAVNAEIIEDNILVLTRGNVQGMADISISAEPAATRIENIFSIFNNGENYDDFETGDFSKNDWQFSGSSDWTIDENESYTGSFSARSGEIGDSQESRLDLTINAAEDCILSFAYKVSSENQWDLLYLKIDGQWMTNGWSGDTGWNTVSFDITAGEHLLTWGYHKDSMGTYLDDCAWIDAVLLPGDFNPGIGDNQITSFNIPEQIDETEINIYSSSIEIQMPTEIDLTHLVPIIEVSDLATIFPESGTPQNFTEPVEYTVTADNGEERIWTVYVSHPTSSNDNLELSNSEISNYPNPFNPETNIVYSIKNSDKVVLEIYNIKGQIIKTLVNEFQEEGTHSVIWNGEDDSNKLVSSGIYFAKIKSNSEINTKKMILLK